LNDPRDTAPKSYLVISATSYRYVKHIADYIFERLVEYGGASAELYVCHDIGTLTFSPGSTIFVIGDPFGPFTKSPFCRYVFLNFSVVYVLGRPWNCSIGGYRLIRHKHKALMTRLAGFDCLLDYYPPQTRRMRHALNLPVENFPVGVLASAIPDFGSVENRVYDVCLVGTPSPRRTRIMRALTAIGIIVSPSTDVLFEEVAAQSRIVLNVHMHRSDHMETPRIVGSLLSGAALVTEACLGMDQEFPNEIYHCTPYASLVRTVQRLLADPARIEATARHARDWMLGSYLPAADARWNVLIGRTREYAASGGSHARHHARSQDARHGLDSFRDRAAL
jgi:hypothetical protein